MHFQPTLMPLTCRFVQVTDALQLIPRMVGITADQDSLSAIEVDVIVGCCIGRSHNEAAGEHSPRGWLDKKSAR